MPNHVLVPTSTHDIREQTQQENLLNRQFLFTVKESPHPPLEVRNLYIKWKDKLYPIGGGTKQNKLIAGDNIEINSIEEIDKSHGQQEEVRLKDDIYINTCTLTPDKNVLAWKGMVKLGEIDDSDFFLIMKKTSLNDPTNALLGGELLVKVEDDQGQIRYLHYAVTLSSTGSWSLKGAGHVPNQLKIGSIIHEPTKLQYYGFIIPKEYAEFTTVEVPQYDPTDLSAYMGVMLGEDEDELYLYNTITKFSELTKEVHIQDFGLEEGDGYTRDIWVSDVVDVDKMLKWTKNNPKMKEENAIAPWLDWVNNKYKLGFTFDTKNETFRPWEIYNTSNTICLKKTGIELGAEGMQPYATYTLTRDELAYTLEDWGADSMATYNQHWYVIAIPLFLKLCGFTPIGDWKAYNTYGLVLGLRIYTLGTITKVMRLGILNAVTRAPLKIIEITDEDIEFIWESDLTSADNEKYVEMENDKVERFCKFIDRELGEEKQGLKIRGISAQLLDSDNNIVSEPLDFIKFDKTFADNNFTFISNLTNNKNPVFTNDEDETPRLLYSGQGEFTSDGCTTLIGVLNTQYKNLIGYKTEERSIIQEFVIKHAEFWFNGWKDIPETLVPPAELYNLPVKYSIVPNTSQEAAYYAETKYYTTIEDCIDIEKGIPSLQRLGEDAAPYRIIIIKDVISLDDLTQLATVLQTSTRQIFLDLSNCGLSEYAKTWNMPIFEGCTSLQELSVPKNLEDIDKDVFKWCTFLRRLDLLPAQKTLHTIGATSWEQNAGFLASTRVNQLLVPKSVSLLRNYLIQPSNIKSLIMLHDETISFIEDQSFNTVANRTGTLSCTEWAWVGQLPDTTNVYTMPKEFHLFFSKRFWELGTSKGARFGQKNSAGSGWDWYPKNLEIIRWNKNIIDSIVIYDPDGTKNDWQEFHDKYGWDELLINEIRAQFGHTDWIEIRE